MIGQLRGTLIEKQAPHLMIDVNGVGYWVQAPLSTFFTLPEIGHTVTLRTHFVVREDAHLLFGFATNEECKLFQEVIKINGVGPKVALAILSGLSPSELMEVVMNQEVGRLQRIPGIGAKTAQRILVEMQDRLGKLNLQTSSLPLKEDGQQEAIAALVSLGYKPQEAAKAIAKVKNTTMGCEQMIKEALQGLAKV